MTAGSALAVAAMIALSVLLIQPISAKVSPSTTATLPADWAVLRDMQQLLHFARAALAVVAFAAFVELALPRSASALTARGVERILAEAMDSTLREAGGVRTLAMWEVRATADRRPEGRRRAELEPLAVHIRRYQ